MDSEIVGSVTEWKTVPTEQGYDGLHDLADTEFSGGVTAGNTWGFMLNGRLIGIPDGSLAAFDGAALTAYEAPAPALPLLYTMQSQENEKQAEYYTNETAIADADTTLSDGNFTGYIKLSENVLSGDYYIVYYGGRSMSVAFVGNSRKLLTGDEALERANDEVGIYNVYAADIDVIDLPERESPSTTSESTADRTDDGGESTVRADSSPTDSESTTRGQHSIDIPQAGTGDSDPTTDNTDPTATTDDPDLTATADNTESTTTDDNAEPTPADDTPGTDGTTSTASTTDKGDPSEAATITDESSYGDSNAVDNEAAGRNEPPTDTNSGSTATTTTNAEPFQKEAEWRNTTTIPSLDPSEDDEPDDSQQRGGGGQQTITRSEGRLSRQQLQERLEKAEQVMEKAEQRHTQLAAERDEANEKRVAAEEQIEELEAELTAAKERIEELETELAATDTTAGADQATDTASMPTGRPMAPADALAGTNLFVRYESKGAATLADAHEGEATPEDIKGNLRIDTHTTFDSEDVAVEETPFEAFLADRIEVAFAEWLVTDLLFELRATGATTALNAVYDAIPRIDRIELQGRIELGTNDEDEPIERTFDCVVRDKRGKPLFVANFDDSKQPVGADLIEGLIRSGNALRERNDSFAAGFGVTSSYFTEDAYEIADDATSGGLFSRSGGESFVNISRKQGFHLCLVDRIKGGFELQKPEL
jgi:Chromosome segregation ATPases